MNFDSGNQLIKLGERHPNHKLTDERVRTARLMYSMGKTMQYIANCLGVHRNTIQAVLEGRTWRHVK